jgi:hypothetical protein
MTVRVLSRIAVNFASEALVGGLPMRANLFLGASHLAGQGVALELWQQSGLVTLRSQLSTLRSRAVPGLSRLASRSRIARIMPYAWPG